MRRRTVHRSQFVFVAFGRGVVLDHAPRWWERITLAIRSLVRPTPPPPRTDRLETAGPDGPDVGGATGTGDRVPRRPPDAPLAGAVSLPGPSSTLAPDSRR